MGLPPLRQSTVDGPPRASDGAQRGGLGWNSGDQGMTGFTQPCFSGDLILRFLPVAAFLLTMTMSQEYRFVTLEQVL